MTESDSEIHSRILATTYPDPSCPNLSVLDMNDIGGVPVWTVHIFQKIAARHDSISNDKFPMPFSGIDHVVQLTPFKMSAALSMFETGCGSGHTHNFAVAMDGMRLYTSKSGAECLSALFKELRDDGRMHDE